MFYCITHWAEEAAKLDETMLQSCFNLKMIGDR